MRTEVGTQKRTLSLYLLSAQPGRGRGADVNYLPGSPFAACHVETLGLRSGSENGPGSMAQGCRDIAGLWRAQVHIKLCEGKEGGWA